MKRIKYVFIILLMLSFKNVKAIDSCTTVELNRLKELANNVVIEKHMEFEEPFEDLESEGEEDTESSNNIIPDDNSRRVVYKLSISNISDDLRIMYKLSDSDEYYDYDLNDNDSVFYENMSITFNIMSYTNNLCTDRVIRNETIEFPSYNMFYENNKDKCQEHPDFKYCKEFMDTSNLTEEEFKKEFDKYLRSEDSDILKSNNMWLYVLIGLIAIIMVIVFVIMRKSTKKMKKEEI